MARCAFEHADVRLGTHRRNQRTHDLAAGRIRGVQDAAVTVAAFAAEVVLGVLTAVAAREVRAEGDQFADALRPLAHDLLDHVAMAEACAGDQRVLDVGFERVLGTPDRGDAALRVGGVGVGAAGLGKHRHAAQRRRFEREA